MFKKVQPFFIIVETPLHVGSGSDLGVVDLPIQRERHTGFPKIESSGLKGSIREVFENLKDIINTLEVSNETRKRINGFCLDLVDKEKFEKAICLAFGPEEGDPHSGALGFTDARLLLFPVKSMKGVFGWITCPFILERFRKEMELAGVTNIPILPAENTIPNNCSLVISGDKIILEEYTFDPKKVENCSKFAEWLAGKIYPAQNNNYQKSDEETEQSQPPRNNTYRFWKEKMEKDIVVLSDDDFKDFVTLSTEVVARTKINNETGTVQAGALFYEEYLPQESILYSLALASPIFNEEKGIFKQNGENEEDLVMEFFKAVLPDVIQIGGNATIGKGIVRIKVMEV